MKDKFFFSFALLFFSLKTFSGNITGFVKDANDQGELLGATIKVVSQTDSTQKFYTTTNLDGSFLVKNVPQGKYNIIVSYIGYKETTQKGALEGEDLSLGVIYMREQTIRLSEAVVEGRAIRATQSGDTISYSAEAFKTIQGSNAEDMLKKMPGVVVQGGVVQAQGEEVKKVLVDGEEFFEGDPTVALKNLPTDIIQGVEVFDRQSDESRFSGIDDGNTTKTINIITKNRRVEGTFGKFLGGYGTENYYMANASFNYFKGKRRISLLGMSNNINQQNFSQEDLADFLSGASQGMGGNGMGRRGGENGFNMSQLKGLTKTHAGGINFSDKWGKKVSFTGSYFFSYADNHGLQEVNREYFEKNDEASRFYNENSSSHYTNLNHRFNARLEWEMDKRNALSVTPQFTIQQTTFSKGLDGLSSLHYPTGKIAPLSGTSTHSSSDGKAFNGSLRAMYRHRFSAPGRMLSVSLKGSLNPDNREPEQTTENKDYEQGKDSTYTQRTPRETKGWGLNGSIHYTEPLSKTTQLTFRYRLSHTYSKRDRQTYDILYNPYTETFLEQLSNKYESNYTTHSLSAGVQTKGEFLTLRTNLSYQYSELNGETFLPQSEKTHRKFNSILPFVSLDYKINTDNRLKLSLRTKTSTPNISKLQSFVNTSNSLLLTGGNPNLKEITSYSATLRYTNTKKTGQTFIATLGGEYQQNYIGDSTFTAPNDTFIQGVQMLKGSQFTKPINQDGYWKANSMLTFGFPFLAIKSNVNLNVGVDYCRKPGYYNGERQVTNTWAVTPGAVISSNISDRFDFTLSYNLSYNYAKSNLVSKGNTEYIQHTASLVFNGILWRGFTLETSLAYTGYRGMSSNTYNQDYFLWNLSVGKKVCKNDLGEIKFTVFDLLKQNKSINRNVGSTYYEDVISNVMPRYVMLSFTYRLPIKG